MTSTEPILFQYHARKDRHIYGDAMNSVRNESHSVNMLIAPKTHYHSLLICACVALDPNAPVVVQFYPWFKFDFPLFWGMVMYDNEFKTMGNKN